MCIFFFKYPYFKRVAKRWLCMEPAWARNQEYYDTKPIKTYQTVNLLSDNLYKILLFLYWNRPTCIKLLAWLIIGVVPRYQWTNICLNVLFFSFVAHKINAAVCMPLRPLKHIVKDILDHCSKTIGNGRTSET